MRSLFTLLAAALFAWNAFTFMPPGTHLNEGASGGVDGETGALAVLFATRIVCGALALLSLAHVEWQRLVGSILAD